MEMRCTSASSPSSSSCSPLVVAGGLDSCLFVWNAVTAACVANFKLPTDEHVNALSSPSFSRSSATVFRSSHTSRRWRTSFSPLSRAFGLHSDADENDEDNGEDDSRERSPTESDRLSSSPPARAASASSNTYQTTPRQTVPLSCSPSSQRDYPRGDGASPHDARGDWEAEAREKKERHEKRQKHRGTCSPSSPSSLPSPLVAVAGNPSVSVFDLSVLKERSTEIPAYLTLQGHTRNVRDVTFLSSRSLSSLPPVRSKASSHSPRISNVGDSGISHAVNQKTRLNGVQVEACVDTGEKQEGEEEEEKRRVLHDGREPSGVICSCSEDGSCRIWDLRTSRQQMVFEHEGRVPIHSISAVCTADIPHYVFMAVASGSVMAWDLRSNVSWEMTRPVRRQAVSHVAVSPLSTELAVVTKYNSLNTFSISSPPPSSSSSSSLALTPPSSSSFFPLLSYRAHFFPHGPNHVLRCRYSPQLKSLPPDRKLSSPSSTSTATTSKTTATSPTSAFDSCLRSHSSSDLHARRESLSLREASILEARRKQEDLGGRRRQEQYARLWWIQQRYAQEWWHKRGGGVWWQHLEDEKEEALWGERERKSTWVDQVKKGGNWWNEFHGAKPWWCQEAESHAWWQRCEEGKKAWWERPRLESSKNLGEWRKLHYQTGGWYTCGHARKTAGRHPGRGSSTSSSSSTRRRRSTSTSGSSSGDSDENGSRMTARTLHVSTETGLRLPTKVAGGSFSSSAGRRRRRLRERDQERACVGRVKRGSDREMSNSSSRRGRSSSSSVEAGGGEEEDNEGGGGGKGGQGEEGGRKERGKAEEERGRGGVCGEEEITRCTDSRKVRGVGGRTGCYKEEAEKRESRAEDEDRRAHANGFDFLGAGEEERRTDEKCRALQRRRGNQDGESVRKEEEINPRHHRRNALKRDEAEEGQKEGEGEAGVRILNRGCCLRVREEEEEEAEEEERLRKEEEKRLRLMERLATAGSDGVCILWRKEGVDGEWFPEREFLGHEKWVWDCEFSEDGRLLATAGSDGTCKLWCVETGKKLLDYIPEKLHPLSVNGRNLRSDKAILAVTLLDTPLTYV